MKHIRHFLSFLFRSGVVYLRFDNGKIGILYGVDSWALELPFIISKRPQWRFYDSKGEVLAVFPEHEVLQVTRKRTS